MKCKLLDLFLKIWCFIKLYLSFSDLLKCTYSHLENITDNKYLDRLQYATKLHLGTSFPGRIWWRHLWFSCSPLWILLVILMVHRICVRIIWWNETIIIFYTQRNKKAKKIMSPGLLTLKSHYISTPCVAKNANLSTMKFSSSECANKL